MRLARLNDVGRDAFIDYLDSLRSGSCESPLASLLMDPSKAEVVEPHIDFEERKFSSRYEVGEHMFQVLHNSGLSKFEKDIGLWTWLAAFYFEELCPADSDGVRKPGEISKWILNPEGRRYYKHMLAGPYFVYRQHASNPLRTRILLDGPAHVINHAFREIAGRTRLVSNPSVLDALDELYFDSAHGGIKRGAQTAKPGGISRFASVMMQFDCTYDLYSMSSQEILDLLPPEFNRFYKPRLL